MKTDNSKTLKKLLGGDLMPDGLIEDEAVYADWLSPLESLDESDRLLARILICWRLSLAGQAGNLDAKTAAGDLRRRITQEIRSDCENYSYENEKAAYASRQRVMFLYHGSSLFSVLGARGTAGAFIQNFAEDLKGDPAYEAMKEKHREEDWDPKESGKLLSVLSGGLSDHPSAVADVVNKAKLAEVEMLAKLAEVEMLARSSGLDAALECASDFSGIAISNWFLDRSVESSIYVGDCPLAAYVDINYDWALSGKEGAPQLRIAAVAVRNLPISNILSGNIIEQNEDLARYVALELLRAGRHFAAATVLLPERVRRDVMRVSRLVCLICWAIPEIGGDCKETLKILEKIVGDDIKWEDRNGIGYQCSACIGIAGAWLKIGDHTAAQASFEHLMEILKGTLITAKHKKQVLNEARKERLYAALSFFFREDAARALDMIEAYLLLPKAKETLI